MEEANQILEYFPISYSSVKEQEYINFLWETFETNYNAGKYQFAFLAYHMLFMCYVYFVIWRIKISNPDDFQKALIAFTNEQEKAYSDATSPFVFYAINERSIFRFLKLIGCDRCDIGNYAKLVDDRNNVAHSNGNIFYNSQKALDSKINDILKAIDDIQIHTKKLVVQNLETFFTENANSAIWEYSEIRDQVRETFVHRNYYSLKDLAACLAYDIEKYKANLNYDTIKELYKELEESYLCFI